MDVRYRVAVSLRHTVFFVALWTASARAGVGVIVTGEPSMNGITLAQIQGWLQEKGYTLTANPFGDAHTSFADCFVIEDMSCAKRVFEKRSKADSVVFARVELQPSEQGREYAVTVYWLVKGHDAVVDKRLCKKCDDAALHQTVYNIMQGLEPSSGLGKGRLKVTTNTDGIIVVLDSVSLGAAPIERDLTPGTHEITFRYRGRGFETRTITVEPNQVVEVESPPPPADGDPVATAPPPRLLPVVLMGAGAATIIGGVVFLHYGSKSGPTEPYIYDGATRTGTVLSIVGVVSIAVGAVLWFKWSPGGGTVSASVGATSGVVSWGGAF